MRETPVISRRIWMPVVAGVTAIAVGVGAFAITAPFAAPRTVEPEMLDAWVLPTSTGLTPLAIEREGDEPPLDELLASTQVSTVDYAAPAAVRAAMLEAVAEVEALELADPEALLLSGDLIPSVTRAAISADPCAAIPPIEGDCPDGGRATVLDLPLGPPLALRGNYSADCAPGAAGPGRLEFQVFSTRPVVLDVTYNVAGVEQAITLSTPDAAEEAWLAAGAVDFIAHCVVLTDLTEPWRDITIIEATDRTGGTARLELPLIWVDRNPVPPSWVQTLTYSGAIISIPTEDRSTVRFLAFAVPWGEPAAPCNFDDIEWDDDRTAIEPIDQVREVFSREQMREQGYQTSYLKRHTAAFVLPEASTITICAGWVDAYSWEGNIPDHVYGEVLNSADLAYPVVSVDDADLDDWILDNPVKLESRFGGSFEGSSRWGESYCGGGWTTANWADSPNAQLCDTTRFATDPDVRWNNTLVISTSQEDTPPEAARQYVHIIEPRVCGYGCDEIAPRYFDVPLPAQRECLGNGCAPYDRSWVRLRVDWVDGQDSWFTDWVRSDIPLPEIENPVLDRSSGFELGRPGPDGTTVPATATIITDRDVTVEGVLQVFLGGGNDERILYRDLPVLQATEFSQRHVFDLGNLYTGTVYTLLVTLTDREGNTTIYDGNGINDDATGLQGLNWPAGIVYVEPTKVDVRAEISARRFDGGPFYLREYSVSIYDTVWRNTLSASFACAVGDYSAPLEYDRREPYVRLTTTVEVYISGFTPPAEDHEVGECPPTTNVYNLFDRGIRETVEVPIEELVAGTTMVFVRGGVEYSVHLKLEPRP